MLALGVLMTACGGGAGPETSQAQGFVDQMAAAQPSVDARKRALAGTEMTVDAKAAFDWAQYTFPDLFPKVPAPLNLTYPYLGVVYIVRGFAGGNYLGVTPSGDIYGLGPFTNQELKRLGSLSEFAAQIRADACKVYLGSCDATRAKELFDWAEYKYPDLFQIGPQNADVVRDGINYIERAYPNGNTLRLPKGSADPTVYGFGPFTDNTLMAFGKWSDFADLVRADACTVYPGSCGGQTTPGPLNECADPAAEALPTGFRSRLVYDYSGTLTGEQTIETVIDGPAAFEGQSAIKITSTTSGTNAAAGIPIPITTTTKVESYEQLGVNGVTKTLGALIAVTTDPISIGGIQIPGSTSSSKTVYSPPRDNLEFHVALGQTGTIVSNVTTTTIAPPGILPVASTLTETFTFEGKDSNVTVPAGTYSTCRYRTNGHNANTYTTAWYILGKGIPVKIQTTVDGAVTDLQQLKSGSTYNGAPL